MKYETLCQENRKLKALVDELAVVLERVKIGCHTAESEAVKRYGENWRNDYIEAALASYWRCRLCGTVFDPDNLEDV